MKKRGSGRRPSSGSSRCRLSWLSSRTLLLRWRRGFAAYDSHFSALSGTTGAPPLGPLLPLPPVPALSFGLVHPSAGSNNVPLASLHDSPVTPTTASQPPPHPHT